jgi:pyrroline-5-carboxylate reductase
MAESMINAMKDMPNVGIQVVDVNEKRLELFQEKYGVEVTHSIDEAVEGSDIVILAVKPQQVDAVADSLTKPPTGAVLSIAAGWSIDNLKNAFRTDRIIRSMPNTPSMVQEGMTVWTSTKETPEEVVRLSRALLGSIGEEVEVSEERYLDMATAISGSGPAVRRSLSINAVLYRNLDECMVQTRAFCCNTVILTLIYIYSNHLRSMSSS